MNPRRIGILVVAIVVAAVAAIGLLNYVRNVEDSALDDGSAAKVWVVQGPISKGTSASQALAQGLIVEESFPAKYAPDNAIGDPNVELIGLVAVFDLPPNEILKEGTFVSPKVINTGITDRLEERELVTVTVNADKVRGVAHQVEPGDYVNILMNRPFADQETASADNPDAEASTAGPGGIYPQAVRYVYQKAEILSVDRDLTPEIGEATGGVDDPAAAPQEARDGGLITLAVPPEAVQQILSVGEENLYLSLVPPSYEPEAIPPFDIGNQVFPAEDPNRLTPYGPDDSEEAKE